MLYIYHNLAYIWDDEKESIALQKHHVSFRYNAVKVFNGNNPYSQLQDDDRKKIVGIIGKRLHAVISTWDGHYRRIITAFVAGRTDVKRYINNPARQS